MPVMIARSAGNPARPAGGSHPIGPWAAIIPVVGSMPSTEDSAIALAPVPTQAPGEPADVARRRADIDAKQHLLAGVLAELQCEAAVLLMPAHVAWFTAGMNVRG